MNYIEKDGTIIINGIAFDNPIGRELSPRDVKRWDEGKRTHMTGLNMCQYIYENNCTMLWQYELQISNRGACFLDGVPLKGEDAAKTRWIFKEMKLV